MLFVSSIMRRPFAALLPDLHFLPDTAMQPVVADYGNGAEAWRINHLPLRVGHANPSFLQEIDQIGHIGKLRGPSLTDDIANIVDIGPMYDLSRTQVSRLNWIHDASPEASARHILSAFDNQTPQYLPTLANTCAKIVRAVAEHDKHWFGYSNAPKLIVDVDHGMVSKDHGKHAEKSGHIHRDTTRKGNPRHGQDFLDRIYLFRSRFFPVCYPNAQTEGVLNTDLKETIIARNIKPLGYKGGSIILFNQGDNGTVHHSYNPTRADGRQPSLFLRMRFVINHHYN